LRPGTYDFMFHFEGKSDYTQRAGVTVDSENVININFKEIAARPGAVDAAAKAKADEQAELFKSMKTHFTNGITSMAQVTTLRTQLNSAAADQKASLQDQIKTQCTTAASEFELADRGVTEKDVKNHAVVLGNLGVAYECLGRFSDATTVLQKAVDFNPSPAAYSALATNLVKAGVPQIDPKNADAQLADLYSKAADDCTKAGTLDPTAAAAATCWRNVGIVFNNAGRAKQGSDAFTKASEVDPKNAETWYLLGGALLSQMDTKQVGDKLVSTAKPGTVEAFQKYLELAPAGPHADEVKQTLDSIASLTGGEAVKVKSRKKN
jgi:tetratricopeptide (TPR) repeat protein